MRLLLAFDNPSPRASLSREFGPARCVDRHHHVSQQQRRAYLACPAKFVGKVFPIIVYRLCQPFALGRIGFQRVGDRDPWSPQLSSCISNGGNILPGNRREVAMRLVVEFSNHARFRRAGIEFLIRRAVASRSPSFRHNRRRAAPRLAFREAARFFGVAARASRK